MDMMDIADPDAVHAVRSFIRKKLAHDLKEDLLSTVNFLMIPQTIAMRASFSFWII